MFIRAAAIITLIATASPAFADTYEYARGHWICKAGNFDIGVLDTMDETYTFVDTKGVGGDGTLSYGGEATFNVETGPLKDPGKIDTIDYIFPENGGPQFEFWVFYATAPAAICLPG